MKFYFAPMEGISGYIYRNAHQQYFNQVDRYFMPFVTPTQNNKFTTKTIKVDSVITDIALFSKNLGINYKIMKIHNPWLRENKLNNASKRMYEIKIPLD